MKRLAVIWIQLICWLLAPASSAGVCTHGMVASVHPLATAAGVNVLKQGGNAVDAAVAVALTLGVVDGENSGLGGGCFILIRQANSELVAIDGRECAPLAATREMFVRSGVARPELSQTGALASGVPGALAAYEFAVTHYGHKSLKQLILPAAEIAAKGFKVDAAYAECVKSVENDLARFDAARAIFLKAGHAPRAGELLVQSDLSLTYRRIAEDGSRWFYHGPFAKRVDEWMRQNGGLLRERDFQKYHVQLREPVLSTYRGYRLAGFPPPSSGGVHVAQILNILECFEVKSLETGARLHLIGEAMKLAFADRAFWLGDSDFVGVPRGLADKTYARAQAARLSLDHVTSVVSHGTPPDALANIFRKHTTHFSTADSEGNWVACTATINTSFGSKVVIPGTGVVMNNEMDDFSIQPGVTNFFGLVGAEANAVAPGKRPLSSMSPTIVFQGEKPILALGAAGGPKIISQVVLELIGILDLGYSPQKALTEPRIHHQWSPDRLMFEPGLSANLQAELRRRGHVLEPMFLMGVSQIVARDRDGVGFIGVADPRAGGSAAGW